MIERGNQLRVLLESY